MLTKSEIDKVVAIRTKLSNIDTILNEIEQATEYNIHIAFLQSGYYERYGEAELFFKRRPLKLAIMALIKNYLDKECKELNTELSKYVEDV